MAKDARERALDAAETDSEDEPRRNTIVPSFDVATFARAVDGTQPRSGAVTITNEGELEAARAASMKSSLPPARSRVRSEAEVEISTAEMDVEMDAPESNPVESDAEIEVEAGTDDRTYEEVLGDLEKVPRLLVSAHQVPTLGLDHHAGFMLALIDGVLNYETIIDVCGMPREDALRVLATLVRCEIVGLKDSR